MIEVAKLTILFLVSTATVVAWFAFVSLLATWIWEDKPVGRSVATWAVLASVASSILIVVVKAY